MPVFVGIGITFMNVRAALVWAFVICSVSVLRPAGAQNQPPITAFRIQASDAVLTDLRQRLERARLPDEIEGAGWDYGTDLRYLRDLVTYWRDRFDWRAPSGA